LVRILFRKRSSDRSVSHCSRSISAARPDRSTAASSSLTGAGVGSRGLQSTGLRIARTKNANVAARNTAIQLISIHFCAAFPRSSVSGAASSQVPNSHVSQQASNAYSSSSTTV
jgi:hypothetical protein